MDEDFIKEVLNDVVENSASDSSVWGSSSRGWDGDVESDGIESEIDDSEDAGSVYSDGTIEDEDNDEAVEKHTVGARTKRISACQDEFIRSMRQKAENTSVYDMRNNHNSTIFSPMAMTWVHRPSKALTPEGMHVRPVGIWWPSKMFKSMKEKIPCPGCNKDPSCRIQAGLVSYDDGFWTDSPREIIGWCETWFLQTRRYTCKKCGLTFKNSDPRVLRLCPEEVRICFNLVLTKRAGIERELSRWAYSMWVKSPAWCVAQIRESHVRHFGRLESEYYSRAVTALQKFVISGKNSKLNGKISDHFKNRIDPESSETKPMKATLDDQEAPTLDEQNDENFAESFLSFKVEQVKGFGKEKQKVLMNIFNVARPSVHDCFTGLSIFLQQRNLLDVLQEKRFDFLSNKNRMDKRIKTLTTWKDNLLKFLFEQVESDAGKAAGYGSTSGEPGESALTVQEAIKKAQRALVRRDARNSRNHKKRQAAIEQAKQRAFEVQRDKQYTEEDRGDKVNPSTQLQKFGYFDDPEGYNGLLVGSRLVDGVSLHHYQHEARPLLYETVSYSARFISIDCTFKIADRIVVYLTQDDKSRLVLRPHQALLTITNEYNQVVYHAALANSENNSEIKAALERFRRIRVEMGEKDYKPDCVWTDTCCSRSKGIIEEVFGKDVPVRLDLFHWLRRLDPIMATKPTCPRRLAFQRALVDAFIMRNSEEVKKVEEEHKGRHPKYIRKKIAETVPGNIPEPTTLMARIIKVFETFCFDEFESMSSNFWTKFIQVTEEKLDTSTEKNKVFPPNHTFKQSSIFLMVANDGSGRSFFQVLSGLFGHVRKGCLSDPLNMILQTRTHDGKRLIGNRGTNANEAFHRFLSACIAYRIMGLARADIVITVNVAAYNRSRLVELEGLPQYYKYQPLSHRLIQNSIVHQAFKSMAKSKLPYPNAGLPACTQASLSLGIAANSIIGNPLTEENLFGSSNMALLVHPLSDLAKTEENPENATLAARVGSEITAFLYALGLEDARYSQRKKRPQRLSSIDVIQHMLVDLNGERSKPKREIINDLRDKNYLFKLGKKFIEEHKAADVEDHIKIFSLLCDRAANICKADVKLKVYTQGKNGGDNFTMWSYHTASWSNSVSRSLHIGRAVGAPGAARASFYGMRLPSQGINRVASLEAVDHWIAFQQSPFSSDESFLNEQGFSTKDPVTPTVPGGVALDKLLNDDKQSETSFVFPPGRKLLSEASPIPFVAVGGNVSQKAERKLFSILQTIGRFSLQTTDPRHDFRAFERLWSSYTASPSWGYPPLYHPDFGEGITIRPKTAAMLREYALWRQRQRGYCKAHRDKTATLLGQLSDSSDQTIMIEDAAAPGFNMKLLYSPDIIGKEALEEQDLRDAQEFVAPNESLGGLAVLWMRPSQAANFTSSPVNVGLLYLVEPELGMGKVEQMERYTPVPTEPWRTLKNLNAHKYCSHCHRPNQVHRQWKIPFGPSCRLGKSFPNIVLFTRAQFKRESKIKVRACSTQSVKASIPGAKSIVKTTETKRMIDAEANMGPDKRARYQESLATREVDLGVVSRSSLTLDEKSFWQGSAKILYSLDSNLILKLPCFRFGDTQVVPYQIQVADILPAFRRKNTYEDWTDIKIDTNNIEKTNNISSNSQELNMNNFLLDAWCSLKCENNRFKTSSKPCCVFVSPHAYEALLQPEHPNKEGFSEYVHKAIVASIPDLNWEDNTNIYFRGENKQPRIAVPRCVDYVFFPVLFSNHWTLTFIDFRSNKCVHFDPKAASVGTQRSNANRICLEILFGPVHRDKSCSVVSGHQHNSHDCGYHVAALMHGLSQHETTVDVDPVKYWKSRIISNIREEDMPTVHRPSFALDIVKALWKENLKELQGETIESTIMNANEDFNTSALEACCLRLRGVSHESTSIEFMLNRLQSSFTT